MLFGVDKVIKFHHWVTKNGHKVLERFTPNVHNSAAYEEYTRALIHYFRVLPSWTFPILPLAIAAAFQVFAWFGGTLLSNLTAIPRVLVLWGFALGEYSFMSPAMNAAKEVLGMSESLLVVLYQVVTLVVFIIINTTVFKNPFEIKYLVSYSLLAAAVYVAYMW
jgi:uncharacterized protein (DUF486 family)